MSVPLSSEELLVFAALVRSMVRQDGKLSPEETAAIEDVAAEILSAVPEGSPYRAAPTKAGEVDTSAVWDLLERATAELSDDESLRQAAKKVTRQPARDVIYEAVYAVAASDVIEKQEWPLLDWLAKTWEIKDEESGEEEEEEEEEEEGDE